MELKAPRGFNMQFVRLASLAGMLLAASSLAAQWTAPVIPGPTPNSLVQLGNDCFEFTSTTNNRGVVWNNTPLDLSQPFDMTFTVSQTPNGADGLAFVLQNAGTGAYGASGNANGFATPVPPDPFYTGIIASVGVELDCQDNSGAGVADIPADHIAVHVNGDITTAAAGPAAAIPNGSNINDGNCRLWRIVWVPAPVNRMDIYFNNVLRLTYNNDMVANVFGGNPAVTWGLTGSCGASFMTQTVCVSANFANAGPDMEVCPGTTQLNASGGTTYFWGQGFPLIDNQNIPNPNFTGVIPAPYTLSLLVTNATGCQDRDTVIMTVVPNPTADAGSGGNVCIGDSIRLGVTPDPDYAYSWSPTAGLSDPTAAQPWFVPTVAGPVTYTLTVTDTSNSAGCTDTDVVNVTAFNSPSVTVAPTSVVACEGASITLTATPSGGTPGYNFAWSTGGSAASETFTATVSGPVSVTVTDASSCSATASSAITVNDTAVVILAPLPDTICSGNPVTVQAFATGTGVLTYAWSTGQVVDSFVDFPAVTTTYTVTVTSPNGCEGHASATVVVNPGEFVDIILPDTSVCGGGSIDINGVTSSAGITGYQWSPTTGVSNPNISTPVITPTASTTYVLTATNANTGCTIQDSIRIDFSDVQFTHWTDSLVCLGDSVVFNIQPTGGSGNYTYLWQYSPGNTLSNDSIANPSVFPVTNGTYFITVTDTTFGCQESLTINVNVTQLQIQANPTSALLNPGQHIELEVTGATSYTWTGGDSTYLSCNDCPNPTARPQESVTYTIIGTDTTGCRGTATVVLSVDSLLVPNMFSPNGDGINDELELNYYGAYGNYQILIYDRWGHQLFATTDKQLMWNGKTAGGQDVPEGVYYLHVRILGDDAIPSKDKNRVFHVTLLR